MVEFSAKLNMDLKDMIAYEVLIAMVRSRYNIMPEAKKYVAKSFEIADEFVERLTDRTIGND